MYHLFWGKDFKEKEPRNSSVKNFCQSNDNNWASLVNQMTSSFPDYTVLEAVVIAQKECSCAGKGSHEYSTYFNLMMFSNFSILSIETKYELFVAHLSLIN